MKRLLIILGLGLTIGMANVNAVEAQIVNVYVNIDMQPAWGPAGYNYAAFYYFPALNIYYDVHNALFYYLSGRRWLSSYYLPIRYQRYDLYTMYKVVINEYHNPWLHYRTHRGLYANYRNVSTQIPIRSMTADRRYAVARTNTRVWVEQRPTANTSSASSRNTNAAATQNRNATTATQNRNTATSQSRSMTTATQNNNATASRNTNAIATQNRNTATSQSRSMTTATQNNNATTRSSTNARISRSANQSDRR